MDWFSNRKKRLPWNSLPHVPSSMLVDCCMLIQCVDLVGTGIDKSSDQIGNVLSPHHTIMLLDCIIHSSTTYSFLPRKSIYHFVIPGKNWKVSSLGSLMVLPQLVLTDCCRLNHLLTKDGLKLSAWLSRRGQLTLTNRYKVVSYVMTWADTLTTWSGQLRCSVGQFFSNLK